jgi:hypothetical protein
MGQDARLREASLDGTCLADRPASSEAIRPAASITRRASSRIERDVRDVE